MKYFVLAVLFCIPFTSNAAVVINEVAWMGNANSANDEWIELFNTGSGVSLDGWMLTDGMNLEIELSGTMGAGAFAVLERTDDDSANGSAFLIYTGALTNTGATLKLLRGNGSIEDQVAGGENWENIGGDNVTKETAQLTTAGWTTGTPTPGRKNVSYEPPQDHEDNEDENDDEDEAESETVSVTSSERETKSKMSLLLDNWKLELTLAAPKYAYVHQPVTFSVEPDGIPEVLLKSVGVNWNMGDLSVLLGQEVTHQYEYPGTYVVVANGEFNDHEATFRHEITVLPVTFSITHNSDGDLQVNNDSKYEVDLSGYSMRGSKTVVFPEDTILLPNATLTIPRERLGDNGYAWLMDQAHAVVASTMNTVPENSLVVVKEPEKEFASVATEIPQVFLSPPTDPVPTTRNSNFTFAEGAAEPVPEIIDPADFVFTAPKDGKEEAKKTENTATVNQAQVPIPNEKLPYLGLVGVLSLGILALYATRVR